MVYEFHFWVTIILIAVVLAAINGICAYLTLLERKIAAWVQDRIGPNRVGPLGLLQPIADGLKFLMKEQIIPTNVDKLFYLIAPGISLATALLAFAVVPFGPTDAPPQRPWPQTVIEERAAQANDARLAVEGKPTFAQQLNNYNNRLQFVIAPHVDIGLVFVFAIGSLAAYAIILGGWSSNNKYSMLGGLRSSAQLISYEIPMGMSVLGVLLLTGSLNVERIIEYQHVHGWNVLFQPLACLLFVTSIYAECNRVPFDLPECEQELVGGYHTEYSAMKFALFMLAEYAHMITTSFLAIALFFGGWLLPGVAEPGGSGSTGDIIIRLIVFGGKMFLFILFYMMIRWTIPRFRFDQLMGLAWKVFMPLTLVNLVLVIFVRHYLISPWWLLVLSLLVLIGTAWFTAKLPPQPSRARTARFGQSMGHPVLVGDEIGPE